MDQSESPKKLEDPDPVVDPDDNGDQLAEVEIPRTSEADMLRRICEEVRVLLSHLENLTMVIAMREATGCPPTRTIGVCKLPADGGKVKEKAPLKAPRRRGAMVSSRGIRKGLPDPVRVKE